MGQVIAPWTPLEVSDPRLARRQRQRVGLATIRTLPDHQQARALWERWPIKVPRAVWRTLTGAEREGWRVTAKLAILIRRFACWPVRDPADARERLHELGHLAKVMHRAALRRLLEPVMAHPAPQHVTVYYSVYGMMGPFNRKVATFITHAAFDPQGEWGPEQESVLNALALGLLHGGTVVVRQQLTLKVERRNAAGEWAWTPQERVMGATLCDPVVGDWCPQPAWVVRDASQRDGATGQPRKPEPHWSFTGWPGAPRG